MIDPTDDTAPGSARPEAEATAAPAAPVSVSPAVERFNACRWRSQEKGRHCTHRDVLPLAGRDGFNPEAWCPDCAFFKIRRTPKKRDPDEYRY